MAAVIDSEIKRQANLRSLQRIDPKILDLCTTVSHVVLYEFSITKKTWEKNNIEGSLFVVKRQDNPIFKLVVLNRSSNENLEVPITSTFQMQKADVYLIFRDASNTNEAVRGIWFHDGEERENFVRYVENVVKTMGKVEEMRAKEREAKSPPENIVGSNDAGAALLATLNLGKASNTEAAAQIESSPQNQLAAAVSAASLNSNLVLDKKSLQLSLLSLIQDERFLDLIHAQYIKVVNARNAREQQARRESDK
ncbi:hypothetical protein ACHAWO_005170 [Cyclotella atomus]|uniref:Uncharacterized protein n=1 Tax=Cyclotella atomus TaxID=382360 RepID=A0ABD3N544_9STRA